MKEEDHFKNIDSLIRPSEQDIKEIAEGRVTQFNWIKKRDYITNRRADIWRQVEKARNETKAELDKLAQACREYEAELSFHGEFAIYKNQVQTIIQKADERDVIFMKGLGFHHMIADFYEGGVNQFYRQAIEMAVKTEREAEFCAKLAEMESLKEQLSLNPQVLEAKLLEVKAEQEITREQIKTTTANQDVLNWYSYKTKVFSQIVRFKSELRGLPNQTYCRTHVEGQDFLKIKAFKELTQEGCIRKVPRGRQILYEPLLMPKLDWTIDRMKEPSAESESASDAPINASTRGNLSPSTKDDGDEASKDEPNDDEKPYEHPEEVKEDAPAEPVV